MASTQGTEIYSYRVVDDKGIVYTLPASPAENVLDILRWALEAVKNGKQFTLHIGTSIPTIQGASGTKQAFQGFLSTHNTKTAEFCVLKGQKRPKQRDHWLRLVNLGRQQQGDWSIPTWVWYGAESERKKKGT